MLYSVPELLSPVTSMHILLRRLCGFVPQQFFRQPRASVGVRTALLRLSLMRTGALLSTTWPGRILMPQVEQVVPCLLRVVDWD